MQQLVRRCRGTRLNGQLLTPGRYADHRQRLRKYFMRTLLALSVRAALELEQPN